MIRINNRGRQMHKLDTYEANNHIDYITLDDLLLDIDTYDSDTAIVENKQCGYRITANELNGLFN